MKIFAIKQKYSKKSEDMCLHMIKVTLYTYSYNIFLIAELQFNRIIGPPYDEGLMLKREVGIPDHVVSITGKLINGGLLQFMGYRGGSSLKN